MFFRCSLIVGMVTSNMEICHQLLNSARWCRPGNALQSIFTGLVQRSEIPLCMLRIVRSFEFHLMLVLLPPLTSPSLPAPRSTPLPTALSQAALHQYQSLPLLQRYLHNARMFKLKSFSTISSKVARWAYLSISWRFL